MQEEKLNIFLLITGQIVSVIGSSIYLVTVILFIKDLTGQPSALGIFQFIAYLPIIFLAPFGGIMSDTADKKRLIVMSDLFRGLIMTSLGILLLQGMLTFSILLAGTFLVSCFTAVFLPAVHSLFPEITPPAYLRKVNSLKTASLFGANLAGTSLGGIAYSFPGPAWIFIINGISFAASAFEETFIRTAPGPKLQLKISVFSDAKEKLREAVNYFRREKEVSTVLAVYALVNSLYPPIILSLPFLLEENYGAGRSVFGIALAMLLGGGGAGAIIYGFSSSREKYNRHLFFGSLLMLSVLLGSVFIIKNTLMFLVMLPAAGFSIGVVHQIITTSLYRLVSPEKRGSVFGIMEGMASFSVPVSYALGGFLIQFMQDQLPLFYLLMGTALASAAALILFRTRSGSFLS